MLKNTFKTLDRQWSEIQKEVVFCNNCVVSNQRPRTRFNKDGICLACQWAYEKDHVVDWRKRENELIDLCEFIQSLNQQIRILKLDVEGVESPILRKIISTGIRKKIDYTFVETHDHKIPELIAETNALRELIKNRKIGNINLNWT